MSDLEKYFSVSVNDTGDNFDIFQAISVAKGTYSASKKAVKGAKNLGSNLSRLISSLKVEEKGNIITVLGIDGHSVVRSIEKLFGTSRVSKHMFSNYTYNRIEFRKFFAVDVFYIFKKLKEENLGYVPLRQVNKVLELLMTQTWLGEIERNKKNIFNWSNLNRFHKTPLPHQKEFLERYEKNVPAYQLNGYLLAAPPGSGKTMSDLFIAELVDAKHVFIVSPKAALYDPWIKTLEEEYKEKPTIWTTYEKPEYNKAPDENTRFFVVHYEALGQLIAYAKTLKITNPTVILDESHNFNDVKSQRTQNLIELCKDTKATNVIFASGTPLKALGYEIIPLLRCIDPFFDKYTEEAYKKIFGASQSRAIDILAHRIGIISHTVEKSVIVDNKTTYEEILVKIPNGKDYTLPAIKDVMQQFIKERTEYYAKHKKHFHDTYWAICKQFEKSLRTPEERNDYNEYRAQFKEFAGQYDPMLHKEQPPFCNNYERKVINPTLTPQERKDFHDAKSVVKYVDLKIMGECLGRVLGKLREQCNVDMLHAIDFASIIDTAEKKTLFFTSYTAAVQEADLLLKDLGYEPLLVYGDTNKNLTAIIKEYAGNPDANPLVATYQSLSTAVPLVMANKVVLLNSPFREHERKQAIARVDRIGQDAPVKVVEVLLDTDGEPNISTRSKDIMEWSKEQVARMMGMKDTSISIGNEEAEAIVAELTDESNDLTYTQEKGDESPEHRSGLLLDPSDYTDYTLPPLGLQYLDPASPEALAVRINYSNLQTKEETLADTLAAWFKDLAEGHYITDEIENINFNPLAGKPLTEQEATRILLDEETLLFAVREHGRGLYTTTYEKLTNGSSEGLKLAHEILLLADSFNPVNPSISVLKELMSKLALLGLADASKELSSLTDYRTELIRTTGHRRDSSDVKQVPVKQFADVYMGEDVLEDVERIVRDFHNIPRDFIEKTVVQIVGECVPMSKVEKINAVAIAGSLLEIIIALAEAVVCVTVVSSRYKQVEFFIKEDEGEE